MEEELLKVHCESPATLPLFTHVQLTSDGGRTWKHHLGDASTYLPYPRNTWLSPMNRRSTFFTLVAPENAIHPGTMHLVPRNVVASAELAITPESTKGCAVFPFEIRNVDLKRYIAR
jgi:hypothetical protein